MNFKIDKNTIKMIDFHSDLSDLVIGDIKLQDDIIEFNIFDDFSLKIPKNIKFVTNFGKNNFEFINVYTYTITKGTIKGKILDYNYLFKGISFQLIEIYYKKDVLTIKADIINNELKLNKENIIIEFVFDSDDLYFLVKDC